MHYRPPQRPILMMKFSTSPVVLAAFSPLMSNDFISLLSKHWKWAVLFAFALFFSLYPIKSITTSHKKHRRGAPQTQVIVSICLSTTNKLPFIRLLTLCRMHSNTKNDERRVCVWKNTIPSQSDRIDLYREYFRFLLPVLHTDRWTLFLI